MNLTQYLCGCNCGTPTMYRFSRGHDARLRMRLREAVAAKVDVLVIQGTERRVLPAVEAAGLLSNPRTDWVDLVTRPENWSRPFPKSTRGAR